MLPGCGLERGREKVQKRAELSEGSISVNRFIKETNEVMKLNLRQLAVFVLLYRLVAGTLYIRLVNQLLRLSLRAAGYSYLTMSNMGAFICRPVTVVSVLLALAAGMALMLVEIGGLLTAYQASAYLRRVDSVAILKGALEKAGDEWRKGNWRLLPLSLATYLMMNSYLLFRILSRIKPINFVMYELLRSSGGRLGLVVVFVLLVVVGMSTMLVFFTCMVEQKSFQDGLRRSVELLKRQRLRAVGLLLFVNVLVVAFLLLLYLVIVVVSAVVVYLFAAPYASMAVLAAVCSRLELVTLFIGGILVVLADFGALTVIYYQAEMKNRRSTPWDFTPPYEMHFKRKWLLALTGAMAGVSLLLIFDMAYNGASPDWSALGQTEITAHRGSSKLAPENTMAAVERAIDEMADYCELDVQTSADGIVMVCHDQNLKRVAGVDRRLGTMTYTQLKELDVGSCMGSRFAGERIPSLEEVLAACKGRIKLNIELKNIGNKSSLPEQTAALVKKYGMEDQCVITSVKLGYLERVKRMNPNLRTGYILAAAYGKYYENEAIDFVSIRSSFVNKPLVEAAHENGKAVHVWTVNSKTELEQMKLLGVDNIITDYPARAREILYRENATEGILEYLRMMLR